MWLQIQHECKLEVNVEEYVESTVRPFLMDVIYCWSKVSDLYILASLLPASEYTCEVGTVLWPLSAKIMPFLGLQTSMNLHLLFKISSFFVNW